MKKRMPICYPILLLVAMLCLLCGCSMSTKTHSQKKFDQFLDECFITCVTQDALTLHFHLKDPEAYHIDKSKYNHLPSIADRSSFLPLNEAKKMLEELSSFPLQKLTKEQELTASLLKEKLTLSIEQDEKYAYYPSYLGKNGLFSQLAVNLSQYPFYDQEDVDLYLQLLEEIPDYFDELMAYEKKRMDHDLLPTNMIIEDSLSQIDLFCAQESSSHFLASTFDERIASVDSLSKKDEENYIQKNQELLCEIVLPAYEKLRQRILSELFPADAKERLAQYEKGQEYYAFLLRSNVGSAYSPEKCKEILQNMLEDSRRKLSTIYQENPELSDEIFSSVLTQRDPETILSLLKQESHIDFPEISDDPYSILEIPDALCADSVIAYYLIPPVDAQGEDRIYVNPFTMNDENLFSTLAHEGFPGHLYQTRYFYQHMSHPIRTFLKWDGYEEGWGTYAAIYGLNLIDFVNKEEETTEKIRSIYQENELYSNLLLSLCDYYVNYEDCDLYSLSSWLLKYGISEANANHIYRTVTQDPLRYLSYSIGYYEITDLRDQMLSKEDSSLEDFHERFLQCGSCPYYLLTSYY